MPTITLALLAAYLASTLAIGLRWRRRASRDEVSYFVADRSLSTFWGFIGLASLTTGGSTTIVLAAFVWTHGVAGLWLDLAGVLGLAALGLFLAGRVRREAAVTLPEIVGRAYGGGARWAAGLLVLVSEIVWFALLVEGTSVVLTAALGIDPVAAVVGSTAVFLAYTALGGQFAVVRTDLVQYALMVAGISGVALACALARGPRWSDLPAAFRSFPVSPTLSAADVLALLLLVGLPHLVGSDVYAKLLSCRDEATAKRSALFAAASKLVFGVSVAVVALSARLLLPPGPAGETLPRAVLGFAPAPVAAFLVVCLVATLQSSADIVLLSASAVTSRDLLPPLTGRPTPLGFARALALVYGALGLALALAMDRDVIETLKLGYSIFAAGLIFPVLGALLPARFAPPAPAAIAAMVVGGAIAAAGRFLFPGAGLRDPVVLGTAANVLVLTFGTLTSRLVADRKITRSND
jgi:SSS family solute:Na+ symporter